MKKIALVLLALTLIAAVPAQAQIQAVDSLRTEAVRSRGFIRAAETQATKVINLIDGLPDSLVFGSPPDTVFVTDTLASDTLYASDLVPDSAPPEWRVEEPAGDSLSPSWLGDDRQLYTYWAWNDSSAVWLDDGRLQITVGSDRPTVHMYPVFQRDEALWLPSSDGWLPARTHWDAENTRPWVCVDEGEAEPYSFTEKIMASGIALGLKVADWTIGVDSTFAKGLDRLPPACADVDTTPTEPPPMPTGVTLAQEDSNLRIVWDAPPAGIDTVIVDYGWGSEVTTHFGSGMLTNMFIPLDLSVATNVWACVKFKRDGVNGSQGCNNVDWVP